MGRVSKIINLGVPEIVGMNRRIIKEFGGIFFMGDNNLAQPGSLDHLLAELDGELFGEELYPTLVEKAALLAHRIIVGHIFHDGNKRTGILACEVLLYINGYDLAIQHTMIGIAVNIAMRKMSYEELVQYLSDNIRERKDTRKY